MMRCLETWVPACPKATSISPQPSWMRGNLRAQRQPSSHHNFPGCVATSGTNQIPHICEPNEHVGLLDLTETCATWSENKHHTNTEKRILHTPIQMSDQAWTRCVRGNGHKRSSSSSYRVQTRYRCYAILKQRKKEDLENGIVDAYQEHLKEKVICLSCCACVSITWLPKHQRSNKCKTIEWSSTLYSWWRINRIWW